MSTHHKNCGIHTVDPLQIKREFCQCKCLKEINHPQKQVEMYRETYRPSLLRVRTPHAGKVLDQLHKCDTAFSLSLLHLLGVQ